MKSITIVYNHKQDSPTPTSFKMGEHALFIAKEGDAQEWRAHQVEERAHHMWEGGGQVLWYRLPPLQ